MTSPIETLEMLKTLLDKELITSDEYDSRRSQVLDDLAPAPATAQFTLRGGTELIVPVAVAEWKGPSNDVKPAEDFFHLRVPSGGTVTITVHLGTSEEPGPTNPYLDALAHVARLAEDGHQPCDHTYDPFGQPDGSCALCVALHELLTGGSRG